MPKPSRSDRPASSQPPRDRYRTIGGAVKLVYEDEHVLVVDKPTGIPTVPPPTQEVENVFSLVKSHVRNRKGGRNARAWIIHRLDREASGLLVFAKSEQAFAWLKEDFRAKRVQRTYAAVVEGAFGSSELTGLVQSYLYEGVDGYMKSAPTLANVPPGTRASRDDEDEPAKLAVTHYRVAAQAGNRSLLLLRLDTGRKNQIRVHMASVSKPIVGDRRFGATTDPIGRVCLHAMELGFRHPATGKMTNFISELPGKFASLANTSIEEVMKKKSDEVTELRIDEAKAGDAKAQSTKLAEVSPAQPSSTSSPRHSVTSPTPSQSSVNSSWNHVADWYDNLLDERGSDHHEQLVLPGVMRLLDPRSNQHMLDIACGQGQLCRLLARAGVQPTGVDAAPRLIAAAKKADPRGSYHAGDARELNSLGLQPIFDAASCVLALMNIEPMLPVLQGVRALLKPRGTFVAVMLHPAFRSPGQTAWGWDMNARPSAGALQSNAKRKGYRSREDKASAKSSSKRGDNRFDDKPKQDWTRALQYRRVDGYLSAGQREIVMNPGEVATGKQPVTTTTYHRPIQTYVRTFAEAGLLIDALEEWPSLRQSQPGPRATEENRARREIPMFLAIRAVRI